MQMSTFTPELPGTNTVLFLCSWHRSSLGLSALPPSPFVVVVDRGENVNFPLAPKFPPVCPTGEFTNLPPSCHQPALLTSRLPLLLQSQR